MKYTDVNFKSYLTIDRRSGRVGKILSSNFYSTKAKYIDFFHKFK